VSTRPTEIAQVFAAVVAICDREGLIGRAMFAIDGVKLPSNASKRRSGTRADFVRQAAKLEAAAATILTRHRETDGQSAEPTLAAKAAERVQRLMRDAAELRAWLAAHPDDRRGPKGTVRKSNRTDHESAKLATGKGVIQGYTGVAAVDGTHQIIVEAQAHGTGSEQELLMPVVTALAGTRAPTTVITADAGYHSEANLRALNAIGVDALIADNQMRRRDARFATQARHQQTADPLHDKSARPSPRGPAVYQPSDFTYDAVARTCICPAGKSLYRKGATNVTNGFVGAHFRGAKRDCLPCTHRPRCLRTPNTTAVRNVAFFYDRVVPPLTPETHTARMKRRIDSPEGRALYAQRFGIVEPVFGNLRHNKGLDRFTLRGRVKVDAQWKLFCLVQNIEKLAHLRYAA
jgi:hypothetical protein